MAKYSKEQRDRAMDLYVHYPVLKPPRATQGAARQGHGPVHQIRALRRGRGLATMY